jgi:replicative DNA helicase
MPDELGKIPPQTIKLEEAVLGGLMLESSAFIDVCDILIVESFYKYEHQLIYKAISKLFSKDNPIDMLTVIEELRDNKELEIVGGPVYISNLTSNIASAAHIEYHARIIQQKFIQRELIRISSDVQNKAFDDSIDVDDLINHIESELLKLSQGATIKQPELIGDIGIVQLKELEEISKSDKEFSGLPSGLTTLDRLTNGYQNKKLYIKAGRPGSGKTTLMLSIAKNMAIDFNIKVAIFSLEMGSDEIWKKLISDITDIQYGKLSNKITDEWNDIENAQSILEGTTIFVDDTPGLSIFELRGKARRLKMKSNIDVVFVDYLQLMTGDKDVGNREQEISQISRGLKTLSKELNIPVIALSQLNRSVENRPDKKPQLSDLRESGAIEQDADLVSFIYRPEYYGFIEDENGDSTVNRVDILIRKNRGGKTGDVVLRRTDNFSRIYDDFITI